LIGCNWSVPPNSTIPRITSWSNWLPGSVPPISINSVLLGSNKASSSDTQAGLLPGLKPAPNAMLPA
jgi:hypothetical protein